MLAEVVTALSGLKAAKDLVETIKAVDDKVNLNDVKIGLQSVILEAQQGLFAAQQAEAASVKRIEELEQEIRSLRSWEEEATHYEAADTGQGAPAYRLKKEFSADQIDHWLCPTCFQQRRKAFLMPETYAVGRTEVLLCNPCGLEIITRGIRQSNQARRR